MKIIFNELGVITSIDTTDEPIRQGNVGVNNLIVDFSQMNGVNNLDYACVFTYVRPDKSKINDVIMLSSAKNTKYFEFNFSNKWFFELYGDASITVKLLKDNTVLANGEFNIVIEKTSADNEPQITYDEYLHLVESIAKTQQDAKQYTDDSVQALKDLVGENYAEKTYVDNQLNLCVKLTDIDTDFSLTSTNPIQNKVISKQIKDINYTIMTMKEELFETVLSEIDYKVDYATIYPIPETLSDDDGTHRVVNSDTQLKEIEGNSVVLKQLLTGNGRNETINGITFTHNGDGTISVVGTATATTSHYFDGPTGGLLANHKYLLKGCPTGGSANSYSLYCSGNLYDRGNGFIATITSNQTPSCRIEIYNGITINATFRPQLFDIADNIKSVAEFNRIFPLTYYPYNAGEIKSSVIKGVKVNGYNLFDGELELNYRYNDNGNKVSALNNILSTNYIRVVAGQTYTLTFSNFEVVGTSWSRSIYQFDSNYNYIKSTHNYGTFASAFNITLESNCAYIKFNAYDNGGISTIPTNPQICFHLTGSRTGYAPYKEPRIIQIPQTELPSAGSVHDTIKFVEGNIVAGQQRYNMVRVSRIGDYTFTGSETFIDNIGSGTSLSIVIDGAVGKSLSEIANILWTLGSTTNTNNISSSPEYSISMDIDCNLYIATTKTSAELASALIGKIVQFEKAEPTETTLATDLTFEEVSAIIEQGGSIETIFEIVPPNLKTAFAVNKAIVS